MHDSDIEKSENFTAYYCPYYDEPLAFTVLYHLKVIGLNWDNLFVIVRLGQGEYLIGLAI